MSSLQIDVHGLKGDRDYPGNNGLPCLAGHLGFSDKIYNQLELRESFQFLKSFVDRFHTLSVKPSNLKLLCFHNLA